MTMKRPIAIAAIVAALIVGAALGALLRQPKDHTVIHTVTRTVTDTKVPQSCINTIQAYTRYAVTVVDELDTLQASLGRSIAIDPAAELIAQTTALTAAHTAISDALPPEGDFTECARIARASGTTP